MRPTMLAVFGCLCAGVAAQAGGPTVTREGAWEFKRADGALADEPTCLLTPKEKSRIQVGWDKLSVTGLPKNSIFNYQVRVDDGAASTPALPTADMQNAGTIAIEGDAFAAVLKGQRFQIRILDRWHEAITEDVSLAGLRELRERMPQACR
jgi:hypothetical protein